MWIVVYERCERFSAWEGFNEGFSDWMVWDRPIRKLGYFFFLLFLIYDASLFYFVKFVNLLNIADLRRIEWDFLFVFFFFNRRY